MTDSKENHRLLKLNKFLTDPEKELQSHALIDQKNSKAMQQHEKDILNTTTAMQESLTIQQKFYNNYVNIKGQNALKKLSEHEKLVQLTALNKNIKKKENLIKQLEHNLKKATDEYEKLKAEKTKEIQEDHTAIKAFKKALTVFTKYFGYTLKMCETNDETTCCVVITFVFDGKESQFPIKFFFRKETTALLGFDAGMLLSTQQQAKLLEHYKRTSNNGALLCTLRNIALQKHCDYNSVL